MMSPSSVVLFDVLMNSEFPGHVLILHRSGDFFGVLFFALAGLFFVGVFSTVFL